MLFIFDFIYSMNDRELISHILQGDERMLLFFYRHYSPRLATFIRNKVANESDVEEILQDTLLATIEAMRDFSFKSSLFTFICSIAYHKVIDFYRKKKIKNIFFSQMPEVESLISSLLGPEDIFDRKFLAQKIKNTFASIAPNHSLILKLKYLYGYSVEEIAKKLSISFKSAESQLFRARKAFVSEYVYETR